ncbi:glycerol-3-phosphate dehydrogenase/oxidase [Paenibacillus ginsengarvi]|uniref:Glycerol-3-phosphate dehydrogenase n=1 Tax=Paenibacillus ginsengarvi TaxID=400777 RepID=A0A3B0AXD5_9BACL|nr:glycerol-3-phosphate dehydrogenase/oxidase [Paenibacillus ginsengarvi]RKN65120.1 glycerol-3-phosphate dehydrogenase/oxidase [Paenibacillus ginsengarvi]
MKQPFSASRREQQLQIMSAERLDVLVIGGGITGAGIAWDASLRGLNTGLIEMRDFSWGTSSRSTKLVHGGLRYLKQGEVKLVMEVGRERALLHQKAPHIVIPAPMMLPIYKGGTYGYFMSAVGLYVYDLLAGVKRGERRIMYSRDKTLEMEPLFKTEGLKGSGFYYEYRTDDSRLTVEIAKTAHGHGAKLVNYAKATGFLYENGRVTGVRVEDVRTGQVYSIYAKKIINAAGPWVDRVRSDDHEVKGKRLLLTKGVHLVVDHARLPVKQSAYLDVPDGRMIFVIPREGKTYIGTTDTFYDGKIEEPRTTRKDRDYLLDAVNHAFPGVKLKPADVESSWSGLRPLIREEGKGPSEISRKDEIFHSDSGLITIAGGKLTGFRKMAEKVVDLVERELHKEEGRPQTGCQTDRDDISGGDCSGSASYGEYRRQWIERGAKAGVSARDTEYLLGRYGSNIAVIFGTYDGLDGETAAGSEARNAKAGKQAVLGQPKVDLRLLEAELRYATMHEMTVSASDFLQRRTGLVTFDRKRAETLVDPVVSLMARLLGWSAEEEESERQQVQEAIHQVTTFPELSDTAL